MHIDDPDKAEQVAAFRSWLDVRLAEHGALAGLPHGEAFKLIDRL